MKNGSKDVTGHPWFKTVDWEAVLAKLAKPSYKPRVKGETDTSNFDYYEEAEFRSSDREEYAAEFAEFTVKY